MNQPVPVAIDHAAVMRVAGLLAAFRDGDGERWSAVLAADAGAGSAYRTFYTMALFADRLVDAVQQLSGEERQEVMARLTSAVVGLLDDSQE